MAAIRRFKSPDGIVIAGIAIFFAAGPIKLRPEFTRWTRDLRRRIHANTTGESSGDEDGFASAAEGIEFDYSFVDIHFRKAETVYLNIKSSASHRDDRAWSPNLESGRASKMFLDLAANPSNQKLQVTPAAGLRFLDDYARVRTDEDVAAIREAKEQAAIVCGDSGFRWKHLPARWRQQRLARKLN